MAPVLDERFVTLFVWTIVGAFALVFLTIVLLPPILLTRAQDRAARLEEKSRGFEVKLTADEKSADTRKEDNHG
jgi:hypothetical protein